MKLKYQISIPGTREMKFLLISIIIFKESLLPGSRWDFKFVEMIARIWHGRTSKDNAKAYEDLLKEEIFTGIADKNIEGYRGIRLLKREMENEIEYATSMFFETIDAVKKFMGDDYETAYVLPAAQKCLKSYDKKSIHYEVLHELNY